MFPFKYLLALIFSLVSLSLYAQSTNLCKGSLGEPIINITFGGGDNPGKKISDIVPGANTTYTYIPVYGSPALPTPIDGSYTITNNVPYNAAWFYGATDHTGDVNGYMAFFNANPVPGEFYAQSVNNLCPGTSYQFSAWIANVLNPAVLSGILPDITFRIEKPDGTLVASYKTGGIQQSSSFTWLQYGFFFTTPLDGSSLVLKMTNTNIGGNAMPGNDFAIDDITFRPCGPQLGASFNANTFLDKLSICAGQPFNLYGDITTTGNGNDFLWQVSSDGGSTWADLINSNNLNINLVAPLNAQKNYLYRMLSSGKGNINSINCRVVSNSIALTVVNSLIPHTIVDTSFCDGESISLTSSSPATIYLWSTGAITKNIAVTVPGKYWVRADNNGCNATDSFNVLKYSTPLVSLGKDTFLCTGDSLVIYAKNASSTYLWQDGSQQDSLQIKLGGIYSVAVTNIQGCTAKDTINIREMISPVLEGTEDKTICKNDAAQLLITATGNNDSFLWQPDATLSAVNIPNPIVTPTDTAKYYVWVKNENGCIRRDSVRVNVLLRPIVSARADTTVCKGDPVTLTTIAANATNINWFPAEGLNNSTIYNPVANPSSTITYSISASNGICNATDEVTINVLQLPQMNVSTDTTICGSVAVHLFVSGANTYTWFPTNTLNNASIYNPVALPSQTVTYYVKGTGYNGCANVDSVKITVASLPVFAIHPLQKEVCLGDSILVTAYGGDIYNWDLRPDVSQPEKASTFIKPLYDGIYKVVVTNNTCKVVDTLFTSLSVAEKPKITISSSNDIDCTINNATLTVTGASIYNWSPDFSLSNPNSSSPLATPHQTTVYHVKATGKNGCTVEDSITVKVAATNSENGYKIASAFTPNNDGINDCFGLTQWSVVNNLNFSIYNRWGLLLFHSNKVSDCWDGTYNGILQPNDTYVYQVRAETLCGNIYKKGTVVLLR